MAAFAPMPRASVRMTIAARPLVRLSEWKATRKSRRNDIVLPPQLEGDDSIARANGKHHSARYLVSGVSSTLLVFRMPCRKFGHLRGPIPYPHYNDEWRERHSTSLPGNFGNSRAADIEERSFVAKCAPLDDGQRRGEATSSVCGRAGRLVRCVTKKKARRGRSARSTATKLLP